MVIPKFARRNGIAVQLYVLALVALSSLLISVTLSHRAAAVLPLNKIPVVGQPLADTTQVVADRVVQPAVQTVTSILPEPLSRTVQAPVNTVTGLIEPVTGTSPQANANSQRPTANSQPVPANSEASQNTDSSVATTNPENTTKATYPLLDSTIEPVNKHSPILGVSTKNFASSKDISTIIAVGSILLTMTLLFVSLIAMIIHSRIRSTIDGEQVLARSDPAYASIIVTGLIGIGSVLLYAVLSF